MLTESLLNYKSAERAVKPEEFHKTDNYRGNYASRNSEGKTFAETMRSVQEQPEARQKPVENETKTKVEKKIQDIEKKIAELKNQKDLSPAAEEGLAKLETMVEKIKALLENAGDSLNGQKLDFGKVSIDISAFLEMALGKMENMLRSLDSKEWNKFSEFLNGKLGEIEAMIATLKPQAQVASTQVSLENADNKDQNSVNEAAKAAQTSETGDKVKVIDKRTDNTAAATPVAGDKQTKGTVSVKQTPTETAVQTAQKVQTAETAKVETEAFDAKLKTAILEQGSAKAEGPAVAKQYNTFAGTVSRANMEALMQGVTGKALVTLSNGRSELKMNMTPPELGRMSMKFVLEDGQLMGRIVVSTPEAKALFDQNLGELQRQMQQAGINIGSIDVQLGQGNAGEQAAQDSTGQMPGQNFGAVDQAGLLAENTDRMRQNYLYDSSINFVA